MNKVYYIYEEEREEGDDTDDCSHWRPRVVSYLDEVPQHVSRIGVYQRVAYLKRESSWTKTK